MNIDDFFTRKDNDGNQLFCHNGKVTLRLEFENGVARGIGTIYKGKKSGKLIYNKEVKTENIYHIYNAWGINYEIYKDVDAVIIHIKNSKDSYQIKTVEVDNDFLHFKKIGYELQAFVHLDEWKIR